MKAIRHHAPLVQYSKSFYIANYVVCIPLVSTVLSEGEVVKYQRHALALLQFLVFIMTQNFKD